MTEGLENQDHVVAALYRFVRLDDYAELRRPLLQHCDEAGVKGTLLLAQEGINGTIAGPRARIDSVIEWLRSDPRLSDLEWKESYHGDTPFHRMKVKLKREIVTMGVDDVDPTACVGRYATPEKWNVLLEDPDCLVIDTRNDYEVAIGTFAGAVNPQTESFREFPEWVRQNLDQRNTARSRCSALAVFGVRNRPRFWYRKALMRSGICRGYPQISRGGPRRGISLAR